VIAAAAALVTVLTVAGCSKRPTQLQALEPRSTASKTCDALDDVCPVGKPSCDSCVANATAFSAGFCNIDDGDDPCASGDVTNDYRAYCKVLACNGSSEADCIADGKAACKSGCGAIDPIVKHCAGWSTSDEHDSCGKFTSTQQQCIAAILKDLSSTGDECVNWYEPNIICLGKHISIGGYASCAIEDCLGLTSLEECAQTYEILCGWTI
jgi:hypothetical protein